MSSQLSAISSLLKPFLSLADSGQLTADCVSLCCERKEDGNRASPLFRIIDLHGSPVIPHNPMAEGQPEAGPLWLGGKEGVEEVLPGLERETRTLIDHSHRRHRQPKASWRASFIPSLYGERSSPLHRLGPIPDEIEKDLTDLVGIGSDEGNLGIIDAANRDVSTHQYWLLESQELF